MSIDQAVEMKKSTWKREVKTKLKKKIQQRLTDDLKEKTITRTIQRELRKNYPKNDTDPTCPICRNKEDTTEHVLDWEVELGKGKHTIGSSNIKHWK